MGKKKEKQTVELIDDEAPTGIVSTVRLEEIKLKDLRWYVKLRIGTLLPKTQHLYKILMELDEQPYLDRIEELESQVRGTLFEDQPAQRKQLDKSIAQVRKDLEERRKDCETMKFNATSEEVKWKDSDTVILARVPDDIIEAFNRQKSRFGYYKITLESIYE